MKETHALCKIFGKFIRTESKLLTPILTTQGIITVHFYHSTLNPIPDQLWDVQGRQNPALSCAHFKFLGAEVWRGTGTSGHQVVGKARIWCCRPPALPSPVQGSPHFTRLLPQREDTEKRPGCLGLPQFQLELHRRCNCTTRTVCRGCKPRPGD